MNNEILDEDFKKQPNYGTVEIDRLILEKSKIEKRIQWGRLGLIIVIIFTIIRLFFLWKYYFNEGTIDMTEVYKETIFLLVFYIGGIALSFSYPKQTFLMILIGSIFIQFLFLFQGRSLHVTNVFVDFIMIIIFIRAFLAGRIIEKINNRIAALRGE